MIERLTDKAERALTLAQEESRRLGHNFVGSEQLLIGLFAEGSGIAAKSLKSMGASLRDIRAEVEKLLGKGQGAVSGSIPFTPRAKKILELSWEEAKELGANHVGTEHLLLGLLREGKGGGIRVLTNLGVEQEKLRSHVIYLAGKLAAEPASGASTFSISDTPTLDQFGIDLTQAAREDRLDPVVSRDIEINRVIRVMGRRSKCNPLLVGEPGVGKSSILAALARRIHNAEVPEPLLNKRLIRLDVLYLLAQRDPSTLMKECLAEAQANRIILAMDEIQVLLAPEKNNEKDASYVLNWFVSNARVLCIGVAPRSQHRKTVEADGALRKYFQPVLIAEPSVEDAVAMLAALKFKLEEFHDVLISHEAIEHAVRESVQHVRDGFLPDKAVAVLDEACQLVSSRNPSLIASMKKELLKIRREKEDCIRSQQFSKAASLRERETLISNNLQNIQQGRPSPAVSADDVALVLADWAEIL